jgi:hypothetical protein
VREDDLGSRLTGVADLGERAAQTTPAGVLRRRGRRRVAWITAIALAVVLAIGLAGLAVRDRVGLGQVAVNPSAGSIPLPLVSDLGPRTAARARIRTLDLPIGCLVDPEVQKGPVGSSE